MSPHRLLAIHFALALGASVARAEDPKSDPVVYEFGDDMVHGSSKSSHEEVLHVRKRPTRESLIRVREHWLPELYRTAENL